MLTTNDLINLNEYLEENKKRNRINNLNNMSKAGRHFDPLTDQEPDTARYRSRTGAKGRKEGVRHIVNELSLRGMDFGNEWYRILPFDFNSNMRNLCMFLENDEAMIVTK